MTKPSIVPAVLAQRFQHLWRRRAYWAPAAFFFAVAAVYTLLFYYRLPYFDHWELVSLYDATADGRPPIGEIFAVNAGHWHATGYIVMLLLASLTRMAHAPEAVASLIFALLGFWALARILRNAASAFNAQNSLVLLIGVCALFYFSLDQAENWLWGWQVAVFAHVAGVLWCIERLSSGPLTPARIAAASFFAAAAIYAFATGWALLPIGYALILTQSRWRSRNGVLGLLLWTVFFGLIIWHLMLAWEESDWTYIETFGPTSGFAQSLLGVAHFGLNFLASPVSRFTTDLAVPFAFIGLGLGLWSIHRLYGERGLNAMRAAAPIVALAAYAAGAAILTAAGRWQVYGAEQAFTMRYITFGNFFWICTLALAILAAPSLSLRRRRWLYVLVGTICAMKVGNSISAANVQAGVSASIHMAAQQLRSQYPSPDPALLAQVSDGGQNAAQALDILYRRRAGLFRNIDAEKAGEEPRAAPR